MRKLRPDLLTVAEVGMMEPKLDRRCGTPEPELREALLRNPPVGLPSTAKARTRQGAPVPLP